MGPHPGRPPLARPRLRTRLGGPGPAAPPPLQPGGVLQRLRLRGQPHRGPPPPREGHPRRHPQRGLAGLDRRRLPGALGRGTVNALRHPALHLVLRLLLGGLFLYFSLDKMRDPPAFARIVYQWQVLGAVPSNLVAVTLPWLEALAGILLLAGIWRREAALVVAILLVVFIAAAGSVMARRIHVQNSGCTSVASKAEAGRLFFGARCLTLFP